MSVRAGMSPSVKPCAPFTKLYCHTAPVTFQSNYRKYNSLLKAASHGKLSEYILFFEVPMPELHIGHGGIYLP